MKSFCLTLILSILLVSCATIPIEQRAPLVTGLSGNSAQLAQGRALYIGKCTKCHQAEPLYNYSESELREEIIPDMAEKTRLSPEETAAVMAYSIAACKIKPVSTVRP